MHVVEQIAGHESSASAGESEGSMKGGDVLIHCGDPQGERQLLRLGQLPDAVDRDTQVSILLYCSNSVTDPAITASADAARVIRIGDLFSSGTVLGLTCTAQGVLS